MDNKLKNESVKIQSLPLDGGCLRVVLNTANGDIDCLFHPTEETRGVIFVSGALGGFDGPSFGVFTTLSWELLGQGINSLRLHYHLPGDFDQCVLDTLIGVRFLEQRGIDRIALVGHSFGGAVAIMAAIRSPLVKTVVGLSSQTAGLHDVDQLSPKPLLLIHGDRDRNLPVRCSQDIHRWAKEPKELVIYQGSGHFLRECRGELHDLLQTWLINKLGEDSALPAGS